MPNFIKENAVSGFTLSEVLLVLSVIGVVAALTIPSLIQKTTNNQFASKFKKEYSTLSQAYTMLLNDYNGDITPIFAAGTGNGSNAMNIFATKLNVTKNCGSGMGCWYASSRRYLNGNVAQNNMDTTYNNLYGKVILADGTMMVLNSNANGCTSTGWGGIGTGPLAGSTCATLDIDINGETGPNTIGRDYFNLYVTTTGIYPQGSYNDTMTCTTNSYGYGCATKVLTEGAMNY